MSVIIINNQQLKSSKLEIFPDIIFNNFGEIKDVPQLNHSKESIYKLLKSDTAQVYLVMVNKKIASYVISNIEKLKDGRSVLYISYLYTATQFRKSGYASLLLSVVQNVASKNNLDGVMLTCDTNNKKVHEFYIRHGYMSDIFLRNFGQYEIMYKH